MNEWANSQETGGPQSTCKNTNKATDIRQIEDVAGVRMTGQRNMSAYTADICEVCISEVKGVNPNFNELNFSSTIRSDSACHSTGYAFDINQINKMRIAQAFGKDPVVTRVVVDLQVCFAKAGAYEQFGPAAFSFATGVAMPTYNTYIQIITDHLSHIHATFLP